MITVLFLFDRLSFPTCSVSTTTLRTVVTLLGILLLTGSSSVYEILMVLNDRFKGMLIFWVNCVFFPFSHCESNSHDHILDEHVGHVTDAIHKIVSICFAVRENHEGNVLILFVIQVNWLFVFNFSTRLASFNDRLNSP